MSANLASIDAILKNYYIGPLQEELNNEVMCLQLFEKAKVSWAGRRAVIPLHVDRNNGVQFAAEAAVAAPPGIFNPNLPIPGQQGVIDLFVEASYLYGSFAITGQALASAAKGGSASFVGSLEMEMDKLKDDIRNQADRACVSGGFVAGFCNDKDTALNVNAAFPVPPAPIVPGIIPPATFGVLQFRGDFQKIADMLVLVPGGIPAVFTDLSNAGVLGAAGAPGAYNIIPCTTLGPPALPAAMVIRDADPATGTITVQNTHPVVGAGQNEIDFSVVPAGYGIGVEIANGGAPGVALAAQPTGMYSNLGGLNLFNRTRFTGVPLPAGSDTLQSLILTGGTGGAAPGPGLNHGEAVDVTLNRMQDVLDELNELSGTDPDLILVHPSLRSRYMGLLTGSLAATTGVINSSGERATTGDGGFLGLSYGGIPIKTSRHVGRGMAIFLNTKTWKMAVLDDGKFADLDGNVIDRVVGADAWSGFYKWYYDHYTFRPNANAILTGLLAGSWV